MSQPTTVNYAEILENAAAKNGDKPAYSVVLPNGASGTVTYKKANSDADDFAVFLREKLGLAKGDVVGVMAPNCIAYPICMYGTFKAGCIGTNINPLYTDPELEHQLNDANVKVLVIIDMYGDKIDRVVPKTKVQHVVTISVADFLPTFKQILIKLVLRYVKKQIPSFTTKAYTLVEALANGSYLRRSGNIDVKAYRAGVKREDTALYQYTGGTTGVSKGGELTHNNIISASDALAYALGSALKDGEETALMILPVYHIYAFSMTLGIMTRVGNHTVMIPSPRPLSNIKPALEKFEITIMPGINTLFAGLMGESWFTSNPPKSLKIASGGGAATQVAVAEKWQQLTGTPIIEGYGLTESAAIATTNPLGGGHKYGSIGKPCLNTEIRLIDDNGNDVPDGEPGELILRGPQVMKGYLHRPDATAETIKDGWLYTGDVAVKDKDGFYAIVDRKKDMVLVSGFNVYPTDIEAVVAKLDGVAEVCVIGVPDEKTGEAVKVFVVKRDPNLTEEKVRDHCKEHLTGYKLPRFIEFRNDLPKSPVGKILRKDLREEEKKKRGGK